MYCHVPYSSEPCHPADVSSGAVTYPTAPDPASLMRWASALPCALWLQTILPCQSGLWCCHVSSGSGPHLPAEVGSGAATCLEPSDLASQLGWAPVSSCILRLWTSPPCWEGLWHCHVSYNSQWVVGFMNKERHSRLTYAARHTISNERSRVSKAPDT
jgi:hypothetical protein